MDRRTHTLKVEEGRKELLEMMKKHNIEDIFRRRKPLEKSFTYFRKNSNTASRIDMWLTTHEIEPLVKDIKTRVVPLTDHHGVELQLMKDEIETGPGRWILNSRTLKTKLFMNTFSNFWKKWKLMKCKYNNVAEWWEESKLKIKDIVIWCGKKAKSKEDNEFKNLEKTLKDIQTNNPDKHNEIEIIKQQIDRIQQTRSEGARIRAKVKWLEEGEKSSRFFHGLERSRGSNKLWTSITDNNGNHRTDINDILKEQKQFFQNLYSSEGVNNDAIDTLLDNVDEFLTPEEQKFCEKDVTKEELDNIVKRLKTETSPGIDGITNDFYKECWHIIGDDFLEMVAEVLETECTISQYIGLIILLYKNGMRDIISNWRPITLLNCDFKIIEKIFANRLIKVIRKLVKEDQKAYIHGRFIGDNARLMEDLIFECENNEIDGAILFYDQSKAFDRVEWIWLRKVMERFKFGKKFIGWIFMLYMRAKSTVMTNGFMSEMFKIKRGLRQGSPLSALLYIIQAEPLAQAIRNAKQITGIQIANSEIRITSYADDTQIYVKDEKSITETNKIMDIYSQASGAKINHEKTQGILLAKMTSNLDISWTKGPVKALGVPQGQNEDLEHFWESKKQKVKKSLDLWSRRRLSLTGKVHLIRSVGISILTYAVGLKYIPERKVKEINSLLWNFLWDNKYEPVKRSICTQSRDNGGINMPDLQNLVKSRQIMIIKRLLTEDDAKWKEIPMQYIKSLDDAYDEEFFLLNANMPEEEIENCKLPPFYKECIKSWQNMCINRKDPETRIDVLNERLWFNEKIRIENVCLNNKEWAKAGIHKVKDIIGEEGEILKDNVRKKLTTGDIVLYINKILKAIPQKWKDILKREHTTIHQDEAPGILNLQKDIAKLTSKEVYSRLQNKKVKTRWEAEWEEKFGDTNWKTVYDKVSNKLIERKVGDMQWKSINYGLCTEQKQKKMRLSDGFCKLCTVDEETVEHMFYECDLVDRVWVEIDRVIKEVWKVNCVRLKDIIFCLTHAEKDNNVNMILEFIIMSTKWIIWKRRNLTKYEDKWTSQSDIVKWVFSYLLNRANILIKSVMATQIKHELTRLIDALRIRLY